MLKRYVVFPVSTTACCVLQVQLWCLLNPQLTFQCSLSARVALAAVLHNTTPYHLDHIQAVLLVTISGVCLCTPRSCSVLLPPSLLFLFPAKSNPTGVQHAVYCTGCACNAHACAFVRVRVSAYQLCVMWPQDMCVCVFVSAAGDPTSKASAVPTTFGNTIWGSFGTRVLEGTPLAHAVLAFW